MSSLISRTLCLGALSIVALGIAVMFDMRSAVVSGQRSADIVEPHGGGSVDVLPMDEITDEQRREIQSRIRKNIEELERSGQLEPASPEVVALSWPVRKAPGVGDFDVDAISNYVDQNPAFPNQLLDWNCGARTYDQASGYNHKGIDVFTWPFPWNKMDNNEVEIVASAPGTIVLKNDGNFDRSCGFNSNQWNAVYVRHADNSVAWYGHMKNGSLTTKPVGSTVIEGERLGVVGSSGNSTGPHLHFELYNAANQLQDPFQGTCNMINTGSWWASQQPYRVSRINKLMTHSAPPAFNTCPSPATPNEKKVFRPGDQLLVAAYYRDQLVGQQTQYSIVGPNGTNEADWVHNSPGTYSASYWYWVNTIPANAVKGIYKFKAVFNGVTYEQPFTVGFGVPFDYDGDRRSDVSVFRPSSGAWYLQRSGAGFTGVSFGIATDKIAPADYDGDGKTDIALYRPSTGVWYINNSAAGTISYEVFGIAEDIPVSADYDGDGKADVAVFRPSTGTWYRRNSSTGLFAADQFGAAGDRPTVGDFDGDGKSDIGVFRPTSGAWYQRYSSNGLLFGEQFGTSTDRIAPADYDGDGKADIAIYRPSAGLWYVKQSATQMYTPYVFGIAADIPVPADYDGDGKADIGVFRPADGTWYIANSGTSTFTIAPFGTIGDQPTPGAFSQ